jgi:hypothetical protein
VEREGFEGGSVMKYQLGPDTARKQGRYLSGDKKRSSNFFPLPQNLWVELASERCVAARSS